MALKPTISHSVHPQDFLRKLSNEFHAIVDLNRLTEKTYTVFAFSGVRGESTSIVDSHVQSKALDKSNVNSETVVAVAHNFTREARDILSERHAIFFSNRTFFGQTKVGEILGIKRNQRHSPREETKDIHLKK